MLTNRCNLTCAHCCFSCTAEGEDMSTEVVDAALSFAKANRSRIVLGGGEPTLHPRFDDILRDAIASNTSRDTIGVVTNGTIEETALRLAAMDKRDVTAALSYDQFHDHSAVSDKVRLAFGKLYPTRMEKIADQGRAKKNDLSPYPSDRYRICLGSPCGGLHVLPDGRIYGCVCDDAPLFGRIQDSCDVPAGWMDGQCSFVDRHLALLASRPQPVWHRHPLVRDTLAILGYISG
ncbi:radical SAM protein [Candidatus Bathyarchaeota archaeon]|nr:radical SAM protein [Candidatus Bathyarchaeota archaeon]